MARMSKEKRAEHLELKENLDIMANYLNQLENIFQNYPTDEVKTEKLAHIAQIVGKLSILHCRTYTLTKANEEN
jgi:hypothetical protein